MQIFDLLLIFISSILAVGSAIGLYYLANQRGRIDAATTAAAAEAKRSEGIPHFLLNEMSKLPLSVEQRIQTAKTLNHLVNEEVSKKVSVAREEIGGEYRKIIGDKEKTLQFIEEKYQQAHQ